KDSAPTRARPRMPIDEPLYAHVSWGALGSYPLEINGWRRYFERVFRTPVQGSYDVAVLGGGLAGMATALRLQAAGRSTIVLEAHGHAGSCAGYYRRQGFAFDVGATTLVDFAPGGIGAELLGSVGLPPLDADELPGYVAWLPDRTVTLHRDPAAWHSE